jgi:hypothetical protein
MSEDNKGQFADLLTSQFPDAINKGVVIVGSMRRRADNDVDVEVKVEKAPTEDEWGIVTIHKHGKSTTFAIPNGHITKTGWPHGPTFDELESEARSLVKIIEDERSGIRDGNGFWVRDAWGYTLPRVAELCQALMDESQPGFKRVEERVEAERKPSSTSADDQIPF